MKDIMRISSWVLILFLFFHFSFFSYGTYAMDYLVLPLFFHLILLNCFCGSLAFKRCLNVHLSWLLEPFGQNYKNCLWGLNNISDKLIFPRRLTLFLGTSELFSSCTLSTLTLRSASVALFTAVVCIVQVQRSTFNF